MDGRALVYCDKAFTTTNGKTAHGLVRFTERYRVVGVVDSNFAGEDAGEVLDGRPSGIPVFESVESAFQELTQHNRAPQYLVMGLAPDGGRLPGEARSAVKAALSLGLNVDSGLHDFLSNDKELMLLAGKNSCQIRDVRKPLERDQLHFFSGDIEKVSCLKLAVLGTDAALGKRTTAQLMVQEFRRQGLKANMIGTGQTAWMQGVKYGLILDSCVNDFVAGEIEHAVVTAWKNENPDVVVIEGQGSLMNPAYPGGFEILAAGRPDYVILQHAPKRLEYDGFPGYSIQPLTDQISAIELISGKSVVAITVNHEMMDNSEVAKACEDITRTTGLPAFDVLLNGPADLVALLWNKLTHQVS